MGFEKISNRIIKRIVESNKKKFLYFGNLEKKIINHPGRGRTNIIYDLNEYQKHLVVMLIGNTNDFNDLKFEYTKMLKKND